MNRNFWIIVALIIGCVWGAIYTLGYYHGQKYALKSLNNPVITEYGQKRFDIKDFEKEMALAGYYCPNPEGEPRVWLKK